MADYIKREDAINVLSERKRPLFGEDGSKDRYRYMQWLTDYYAIMNLPSADVEEVVHCKDCKHRKEIKNQVGSHYFECSHCAMMGKHDDDYCSYGERKND